MIRRGERAGPRRAERAATRRAALAAAWLLAAPGLAEAGPPDADLVARLFRATGVPTEVDSVGRIAVAHFAEIVDAPPPDRQLLRAIVLQGFSAATLEGLARHAFLADFDPARARAALRWLDQPAVEAIYAAGRAPGAACALSPTRTPPERAAALARVESRTSLSRRSRDHALHVYAALLRAGNALLPETRRFGRGEVADMIARHDRAQRQGRGPSGRACRYRDVPTEALIAAARFLDDPAGRWLHRGIAQAVETALEQAANATALRIVESFGATRRAPLRLARARPGG